MFNLRLMGRAKAMEMLCFGKKINAHEAKERNLVTQIYSHHSFQEDVRVSIVTRIMLLMHVNTNVCTLDSNCWLVAR